MCGLAGYYVGRKATRSICEQYLITMQKTLEHRGPDHAGIWKSDEQGIGLVFQRLSIVDLSLAGAQPMHAHDHSIVICFNGEIYNHLDIRKELLELGYSFTTHSDTQTLIYAYKAWGIKFLEKLEGMFAIVLFDRQKEELFLIRDRMGIKPLYFSLQGDSVSFASEIKALWVLPWIQKNISTRAAYHYLTFMVTPAPYTIFEEVYKLPAGFYASITADLEIQFTQWYSPLKKLTRAEKKQFEDEQFCIEGISQLLQSSVKRRMLSDVPVGAFLSGGLDSSLNVALMAQHSKNLKTFTVAFSDGPEFDELEWARKVAKQFGTDHHEIIISEKEAFSFYEKMSYHLDEPLADCVCVPFYYVSKAAKDAGVTVVQVGEGADELFFGYELYAQYKSIFDNYWNPAQKFVPGWTKKALYYGAQKLMPQRLHHVELLYNLAYDRSLFWGGAIAFNEHQKQAFSLGLCKEFLYDPIIEKMFPGMEQGEDSFAIVNYYRKELLEFDPDADLGKQMMYLELKQRLPELLLMRADKMSMAVSVEGRVPYLDHSLVEFALNIPLSLKFKNNVTKYLLKKVAEPFLPHDIIYRKKIGFAAPIIRWYERGHAFSEQFHNAAGFGAWGSVVEAMYNKQKKYYTSPYNDAVQRWVIQNLITHEKMI